MKALILTLLLIGTPVHAMLDNARSARAMSTSDAEADARALLAAAGGCSLSGLTSLRTLLVRYEHRPEPSLRLLAAQARSAAGFTTWFRMQRAEARHWYKSIVRHYGDEPDVGFQVIVANASYMLARSGGSRRLRSTFLDRVLVRYVATDDLRLLRIYANSLYAKSDLLDQSGQHDAARVLRERAQVLYTKRIIPRLPPPSEPETEDLCI